MSRLLLPAAACYCLLLPASPATLACFCVAPRAPGRWSVTAARCRCRRPPSAAACRRRRLSPPLARALWWYFRSVHPSVLPLPPSHRIAMIRRHRMHKPTDRPTAPHEPHEPQNRPRAGQAAPPAHYLSSSIVRPCVPRLASLFLFPPPHGTPPSITTQQPPYSPTSLRISAPGSHDDRVRPSSSPSCRDCRVVLLKCGF